MVRVLYILGIFVFSAFVWSCNKDDDPQIQKELTGEKTEFILHEFAESGISGTITFEEYEDHTTLVTITLNGNLTGSFPAHINKNSTANPGGIEILLNNVEAITGMSETDVSTLSGGDPILYSELIAFDGHAKIHKSDNELGTIVSQGDIGANELTGESIMYELTSEGDSGLNGKVEFEERESGVTLLTLTLSEAQSSHPAHIHTGSVVEGGNIVISLSNVEQSGIGLTDISQLDDGTEITFEALKTFDGHIRVHESEADFSEVASGDIGVNALTGKTEMFTLNEVTNSGISGVITFAERLSGFTLITATFEGTATDSNHPFHIHENNEINGGTIKISLSNVVAGNSVTHVEMDDNNNAVTYDDLIAYNGHAMAHRSAANFGEIVARGDIGQNALTEESETYELSSVSASNISGTAEFAERRNGNTLVTISLLNTVSGTDHPGHIHVNNVLEGGTIQITFNNVNGATGVSITDVSTKDDGTAISYSEMIDFDGHIVIHKNPSDFGSIAKGDIGPNAFTGESEIYALSEVSGSGVNGTVQFSERKNGFTLVTVQLTGTTPGVEHPSHIHENSAVEGGTIVLNFNTINGTTGLGQTDVTVMNDNTAITYEQLINFDGHVVVHKSTVDFSSVSRGDIGSNAN